MNITTLYIYPSFWTVAIVRQYPNALFVFGDNDCGKGTGGQAIIRNEPNSIGLPTKKCLEILNIHFIQMKSMQTIV